MGRIETKTSLVRESGNEPLVAICMATFNPPIALFRKQIQSIIDQAYQNWTCIISDDNSSSELLTEISKTISNDSRFTLVVSETRLGFYRNFERCLSLAPTNADYIALADQDDYWSPEKLRLTLSGFDRSACLTYCDMNVVDQQSNILANTFWNNRLNNYTDFTSLILVNTVTGASMIFNRELLESILPFPDQIKGLFHDHWIALIALATGKIAFVNAPLYNYTQHSSNVIGFRELDGNPLLRTIYYNLKSLTTIEGRQQAKEIYFDHVVRLSALAKALENRTDESLSYGKRISLRLLQKLDTSLLSALWLALRGLKNWRTVSKTNGAEYHILLGVIWRHFFSKGADL